MSIKETLAAQNIIKTFKKSNSNKGNTYPYSGEHSLFLLQCSNVPFILPASANIICTQLNALSLPHCL